MKKLAVVQFWYVEAERLEPLLQNVNLKPIYFYPNKRHDNYKLAEIQGIINRRA